MVRPTVTCGLCGIQVLLNYISMIFLQSYRLERKKSEYKKSLVLLEANKYLLINCIRMVCEIQVLLFKIRVI